MNTTYRLQQAQPTPASAGSPAAARFPRLFRLVLAPALALVFSGLFASCATLNDHTLEITGSVTYRERIALPPGALLEVALADVTDPGTATPPLAERRIHITTSQPPIPFSLSYDSRLLQPGRQYAVQARITVDGQPWFITRTVNHAMDFGIIRHAQVILQRHPPTP